MSISSVGIVIEPVDTKLLTESDILDIAEVTQDMWADGIGEFVQCDECGHMHSKQDIYGHLIQSHYNLTVRQIMGDFEVDDISCIQCGGKTSFVYGKHNIQTIKDRYQKTVASFLVIARDIDTGKMVGYEDAYIDTLENIYNRELETHYRHIGIEEIRKRIISILGYEPELFLELADMGMLGPYRNIKNLAHILYKFGHSISTEFDNYVGFCEVDRNNIMKKISTAIGCKSLDIQDNHKLRPIISNTGSNYISDIILRSNMIQAYKLYFDGTTRSLLRLIKAL